ncbi:MAG: hypothetical protein Q9212_007206 [Teloschistes hypoglaucus]
MPTMPSPVVRMPPNPLIQQLGQTLRELGQHPYPHVPNPPDCKKRAAVALIIRVRPTFPEQGIFESKSCGPEAGTKNQRLENFFEQEWVRRGDPEVLFIKRAARDGDRWTSHVAFPGGKRDPEDESDSTTSVRETKEEVNVDLNADHALLVGNLSERVVTTWLGKTPLWAWPTLSPLDYRFTIWLCTYAYRKQKTREMGLGRSANTKGTTRSSGPGEIDDTTFTTFEARSRKEVQDSALLEMLGGYYDRAKVAVVLTLLLRVGAGGLLGAWGYRRFRDHAKL